MDSYAPKKGTFTFTMIKPGEENQENIGEILTMITEAGFRIQAMKMIRLRTKQAEIFYRHLSDKPFFGDVVKYMTSGPVVAAVLEKDNAVVDYRKLIGATNPEEAKEGTIRKRFAKSTDRNVVHGSDSDDNAAAEASFFFSMADRYNKTGHCFFGWGQE
ncbi:nucleoside-diphosphate kinase [Flammeovirga yaeyamensis]|uniref:Nucleoside-diphosphate kinase n=1 Tax=Flammeovirga yaeyamensis TaxID=367791 RepID=A0AAX1N0F1_9BACT|nr:nucleoside-diphosphate kinase [Flammeovirga yaeyamensis]MBB3698625.1 nucleoside-diphosphate kinase [Flammeovirga yaeyamensis]NMF34027.1 nucleoside-diphosphate kinase [Flammeovirga yaeyamensis]QWG01015.1 nucleoside-diphosphate kinase [Flammeovirga yaeyamensis]